MSSKHLLATWLWLLASFGLASGAAQAAAAPGYVTINPATKVYAEPSGKSAVRSTLRLGHEISIDKSAARVKGWVRADYVTAVQTSIFSPGTKTQGSGWFRDRDVVRVDQMPKLIPKQNKAWKPTYICLLMTMPGDVSFTQEFLIEPDGNSRSWTKAVAPDGRSKQSASQGQAYVAGDLLKLVYTDTATKEVQQGFFGYRPTEGTVFDLSTPLEQQVYKTSVFQISGNRRIDESPDAKSRCTHAPR